MEGRGRECKKGYWLTEKDVQMGGEIQNFLFRGAKSK